MEQKAGNEIVIVFFKNIIDISRLPNMFQGHMGTSTTWLCPKVGDACFQTKRNGSSHAENTI